MHERDRAQIGDWSDDEKAFGFNRKFRLISLIDRPFDDDILASLRALSVVERVEPRIAVTAPVPQASLMSVRSSQWASRLIGLDEGSDFVDGAVAFLGDRVDADPDPSDPSVGHGSHVTGIPGGSR